MVTLPDAVKIPTCVWSSNPTKKKKENEQGREENLDKELLCMMWARL